MIQKRTKILIIKIGAIGDVVMALSMLNAIDKTYPGAEITWVAGTIVEPILKSIKRIDKIITLNEYKLLTGKPWEKFLVLISMWFKLAGKRYDLIVTAYRDSRYKLLLLTVFSKQYRSFSGSSRQNFLLSGRYHAAEYARLINNKDDWQMNEVVIPHIDPGNNLRMDEILRNLSGFKIIITPGGAQNLINNNDVRRWPIESYTALADYLLSRKFNVIITGSESDRWVLEYFNNLPVVNLIGKTELLDIVYLYSKSDLLICHDTGALHLAKLTDIKTIALFGPVDPRGRVDRNEDIAVIWGGAKLLCSPCYDGKTFAECSNNICMKNISVNSVASLALSKLAR